MQKPVTIEARVGRLVTDLGTFGRISNKELAPFIGKKVKVSVEVVKDD